ncbi:hypothetical protein [Streptomyces sp. DH12]|uniref:hypothetical protein n=1 Tax=Streptomyces sp. DH12 TaxID=2857010 RepID=UPI001E3C8466|nr:hypothetical protein [Streptomyces sp. DH12]
MTHEPDAQLVMPFVIVQSNGGPYDDAAFVAGATCGQLIAELAALAEHGATPQPRYVRPEYLPQIDLIAMRYGYVLRPGEVDDASGYQWVDFTLDEEEGA